MIKPVITFLLTFSSLTTFSQKVDLCKGLQYVAKYLKKPELLEKIEDYGKLEMGFTNSYGDHPYLKGFKTDSTRGRYSVSILPETAEQAQKLYAEYLKKLQTCFVLVKEPYHSEVGSLAYFQSNGSYVVLSLLIYKSEYYEKISYTITVTIAESVE